MTLTSRICGVFLLFQVLPRVVLASYTLGFYDYSRKPATYIYLQFQDLIGFNTFEMWEHSTLINMFL